MQRSLTNDIIMNFRHIVLKRILVLYNNILFGHLIPRNYRIIKLKLLDSKQIISQNWYSFDDTL